MTEAVVRRFWLAMKQRFGTTWVGDHASADDFMGNRAWCQLLARYRGDVIQEALLLIEARWANPWAPKHHEMAKLLAEADAAYANAMGGNVSAKSYWRSCIVGEVWALLFLERLVDGPQGTMADIPDPYAANVRTFVADLSAALASRESTDGERNGLHQAYMHREVASYVRSLLDSGRNKGS